MKTLLLILLFIAPISAYSQTKADYEKVMEKFTRYYNKDHADSICYLFADMWGEQKMKLWTTERTADIKSETGQIKSCKYVGIDTVSDNNKVALFITTTEKTKFMTGMVLDKTKKLETFRFSTSSPYIDSLFEKYRWDPQ